MAADISGVRAYLLRRYAQGAITLAQIEAIADKAATASLAGESTVDITSSGFDGSNSSGVLLVSTADILKITTEILDAIDPVETVATRQFFVPVDFRSSVPLSSPVI